MFHWLLPFSIFRQVPSRFSFVISIIIYLNSPYTNHSDLALKLKIIEISKNNTTNYDSLIILCLYTLHHGTLIGTANANTSLLT